MEQSSINLFPTRPCSLMYRFYIAFAVARGRWARRRCPSGCQASMIKINSFQASFGRVVLDSRGGEGKELGPATGRVCPGQLHDCM